MSNAVNIPKIFSGSWERLLEKELNIGKVAARKFDSEISKHGDTVNVPIEFDTTIIDNAAGYGTIASEYISSTSVEIKINESKAFNVILKKKDYLQVINNKELLGNSVKRAIYKMKDAMETSLGGLYTEAGIVGSASAITISESNAYEVLLEMQILMDEANVEKDGRFAILPSRYCGFIQAQIKNTFDQDEAFKVFGKGYMGDVAGFAIIKSNNVYNDGQATPTHQPLFGVMGQSFALAVQQNPEVREERPQGTMDYAMLGDCYYGVKAHRTDKLATIPVKFSSLLT